MKKMILLDSISAVCSIIFFVGIFHPTLQDCPKEVTSGANSVTWHQSPTADNIESDPLCYYNETLITRNCSDSHWTPALNDLASCLKIVKYFDPTSCPPGYHKITENNNEYCYQLDEPSAWDYPCFASGGASVITDLSPTELEYLINSLKTTNISRYFWVPAYRQSIFQPLIWQIPGPNWGQRVTSSEFLGIHETFSKHCLLLDIDQSILTTEHCSKIYPSLCFYLNDLYYPAKCPDNYYSFRLTPGHGACYGIAISNSLEGLSFNEFLSGKCKRPMTDDKDLNRFIFKKIAQSNYLPNDVWCWIRTSYRRRSHEGIVNNAGIIGAMNRSSSLTCMACEAEVIYGETELMFEYNEIKNQIYLTVYYPSGLWKYDEADKGIQCFSDAKGFVRVVDVNDHPFIDTKSRPQDSELGQIEKIVYVIDLVTDSSAQYWCEGHTVNLSLIATNKMIVHPKANKIHVFSLIIKYYVSLEEIEDMINLSSILITNIQNIFNANKVLIMDIFNYAFDHVLLLLHLHIAIQDVYDDRFLNIQETFYILQDIAQLQLSKYNYTFINISSSSYCLPSTSVNTIMLDWEMTSIGHISAPKQFCLQTNGLPVKRRCEGSYMLGAMWGEIEGRCDNTYEPSMTTTILYNFVIRPDPHNCCFLTEGLSYVLDNTDIIIPADIFYLSMSLQQISDMAQENITSIDSADIQHIAWVMDRVMILDCEYLRLAQTLNSTNVIVDSISDIIETIAQKSFNETSELNHIAYQIAVKPQFLVQISYPGCNNITGIAIRNPFASDNFTDMLIQPLYKNTTLEEVISIKDLEIATWFSSQMLNSIQMHTNNTNITDKDNFHIIITVYQNDAVFQELQNNTHTINSRIIGISIPDYVSNLEYPIPIVYKGVNYTANSFCGYWDFQPEQLFHVPGSWRREGCYMLTSINNVTVCKCYHLTHFGQLFSTPSNANDDKTTSIIGHTFALNIITSVGSFLSLLGIAGIWITALIFGNWRKKAGTKVLLQLSTAIALPLIFILIFSLDSSMFVEDDDVYFIASDRIVICIVLGALLHYSLLASFMWMLITAVLQFIRYVRVLGVRRPARFMFKFALIGWGIPILPVLITLCLDSHNYVPSPAPIRKICYPDGYYLIVAVLVPICVILLINVTLFILVLHAISRGSDQRMKSADMDLVGAQLRVSIFLFFLLGLTWIFGILSFSNQLIWSYLFCLTSTLQGFVLFIYFVICDPDTRGLWLTLMKPQFNSSSSRSSISHISTE